ncbi:hypothetical protein Lser_V15G41614 [Lactuca serriola]
MLVVVTKDANNSILPVAYAIVDEENRHKGIIHAMENLPELQEPLAYHRFCLRHIRSNFMQRYENEIKRSQWCFLYDDNRQWGFLTTNISKSLNNALRGARQLPIKACIDLTFNRTVQLFRKYSDIAMNCNTPLPSCMWRLFRKRETCAQIHTLTEFDYSEGVYKIVTKLQINGKGGNTYTVHYFQQTCTCGKWQMERFPCSHVIAVCGYRGDNPISIVNTMYTTMTYKQQYTSAFVPLSHVDYWLESDWKIKADNSKLYVHRGRRRANRFHNEMDIRHPDEPHKCRLCHQTGHNRRNCPNSQPRFNAT